METDTSHTFHIKHEVFEGPIEVLLDLIEKRKLFVGDVSLAQVTDDFIEYIRTQGTHPDMVSGFLSVASTLILIKARSLIPTLPLTQEEEVSITNLKERVLLLQYIQQVSPSLIQKYKKQVYSGHYTREQRREFVAPSARCNIDELVRLITDCIVRIPPKKVIAPEARVYKTVSLQEVIGSLTDRIESLLSCTFSDICVPSPDADEKSSRVYTIVSFLGMLELIRQGFIDASQETLFDTIHLQKQDTQSSEIVVP